MNAPCRICGFKRGGAVEGRRYCSFCESNVGSRMQPRTIPSPASQSGDTASQVHGTGASIRKDEGGSRASNSPSSPAPTPVPSSFMETQAIRVVKGLAALDRRRRRLARALRGAA